MTSEPPVDAGADTSDDGSGAFLKGSSKVQWSERKRLLRIEAWICLVAAYCVVGFAYLWPPDFRNQSPVYVGVAWTAFMVRTFVFHLGLVIVALAAGAAWARERRLLLATLPLLAIALGPTLPRYAPRSTQPTRGETITVMSVNLLASNTNTASIVDEIRAADPDLLLLQEYTSHWHDALQSAIGPRYPHTRYVRREDSFGNAIYSKRPFAEEVDQRLKMGKGLVPQFRAVVEIEGQQVAVYNVHLLPPWGMDFLIETRREFADLLDMLAAEPLPTILAGDFNFTERSPQARALRRNGIRDAHDLGGWGRGTTWPISGFFRWVPSLRLDHVYLQGGLTCTGCRTGKGRGSDHRPVIAEVGFAR